METVLRKPRRSPKGESSQERCGLAPVNYLLVNCKLCYGAKRDNPKGYLANFKLCTKCIKCKFRLGEYNTDETGEEEDDGPIRP